MLGDRHGRLRRQPPHHRALVAGGDDGDRARPVAAQHVLHELAHLAAALADQRDDGRVEALRAGEHAEQRRFADAGAGEDADALPGAQRREQVDDLDARFHGRAHALAPHRRRRLALGRDRARALREGSAAVDGLAQRIDRAALPGDMRVERDEAAPPRRGAEPHPQRCLERLDGDAAGIDPHHLAQLRSPLRLQVHALAEPHERGEAAHAAECRRHLDHAAADGDLGLARDQRCERRLEARQRVRRHVRVRGWIGRVMWLSRDCDRRPDISWWRRAS